MFPPDQHPCLIQYIQPLVMHTSYQMLLNIDPPGYEPRGKPPAHVLQNISSTRDPDGIALSCADRMLGSLSKIWYGHGEYLSIYTYQQNAHRYD